MHRLLLLDKQPEVFEHGIVLTAYEVRDQSDRFMAGLNYKKDAIALCRKLSAERPGTKYYINGKAWEKYV